MNASRPASTDRHDRPRDADSPPAAVNALPFRNTPFPPATMSSPRLANGSLHHHGAGLLPDDLEGVDYLLLDGGPALAAGEEVFHNLPDGLLGEAIYRLAPTLYLDPNLRVIISLAGRDPGAAGRLVSAILSDAGNADLQVGAVKGTEVLDRLEEFLAEGHELRNRKTGEPFSRTTQQPRCAQLALGAEPIAAAFDQGARLVVLGHADLETIRLQLLGELRGRAASTPLKIKLEAGYSSRVVIRRPEASPPKTMKQLEDAWMRSLQEAEPIIKQATFETAASDNAEEANIAIATCVSDRLIDAGSGTDCLMRLAFAEGAERPSFEVILGPIVEPLYTAWPTSIPTDLVEWSVDVRPARDWVE